MIKNRKSYVTRKLDLEIGYLVKSPCRNCSTYDHFPRCSVTCDILDRIQTHLAQGISSTRACSPFEAFTVQTNSRCSK